MAMAKTHIAAANIVLQFPIGAAEERHSKQNGTGEPEYIRTVGN